MKINCRRRTIGGNYVWIWRALEFQVMLSIKMSSMVFGFWPVCLNLGRDTSSKLGLQLLSLTSP
ncbi:hypothetical protein HanIR_Chr11g0511091 [Helianthus annuus]|nr:hypothetical protein HanIR_Chr11g0511091 [Helianthus annuus]